MKLARVNYVLLVYHSCSSACRATFLAIITVSFMAWTVGVTRAIGTTCRSPICHYLGSTWSVDGECAIQNHEITRARIFIALHTTMRLSQLIRVNGRPYQQVGLDNFNLILNVNSSICFLCKFFSTTSLYHLYCYLPGTFLESSHRIYMFCLLL